MKYARNEASHLIAESDLNSDGKLTRAEISMAYEAWLESSATEHGDMLRDDSLEQLLKESKFKDEL